MVVIALAVMVARPGQAHARVALLAFNVSEDEAYLKLLDDAAGFVVFNEGNHPIGFPLYKRAHAAAEKRCGPPERRKFDAVVAVNFRTHFAIVSIDCDATLSTAEDSEAAWKTLVTNWPKLAKKRSGRAIWLGMVLNQAVSELGSGDCQQLHLWGAIPKALQTVLEKPGNETAEEFARLHIDLCEIDGRPVAPLAEIGIIETGLDTELTVALHRLEQHDPKLARRVARLLLLQATGLSTSVTHESKSGAWSSTCVLQASNAGAGVKKLRASVQSTCTIRRTGSPKVLTSSFAIFGKNSVSAKFVTTSEKVKADHLDGAGFVKDAMLRVAIGSQGWVLDVLRRSGYAYEVKKGSGGAPRSPAGPSGDGAATGYVWAVGRGRENLLVAYHRTKSPEGCWLWFDDESGQLTKARARASRTESSCAISSVDALGADVASTTCTCDQVEKDIDEKLLHLELASAGGAP
jgi:hypothetical protein